MAAKAKGGVKGAVGGDAPVDPLRELAPMRGYNRFPFPVFTTPDGALVVAYFLRTGVADGSGYYYRCWDYRVCDDMMEPYDEGFRPWRRWRGVAELSPYWQLRACELAAATHDRFPDLVRPNGTQNLDSQSFESPQFASEDDDEVAAKPKFTPIFNAGMTVGLIGLIFLLFGLVSAIWVALPSLFLAAIGALMVGFGLWATTREDGA